jgi:hypothetical protein
VTESYREPAEAEAEAVCWAGQPAAPRASATRCISGGATGAAGGGALKPDESGTVGAAAAMGCNGGRLLGAAGVSEGKAA